MPFITFATLTQISERLVRAIEQSKQRNLGNNKRPSARSGRHVSVAIKRSHGARPEVKNVPKEVISLSSHG